MRSTSSIIIYSDLTQSKNINNKFRIIVKMCVFCILALNFTKLLIYLLIHS